MAAIIGRNQRLRRRVGGGMPTRPLTPGSAVRLLAALSLLVATVAACGSVVPTPSSTPSPTSAPPSVVAATPFAFPLVSVEMRGGECPSGSCDRLLNIEADGTIHEVIPKDRVLGTAPPEVIDALRVEVEQADYLKANFAAARSGSRPARPRPGGAKAGKCRGRGPSG